MKTLQQLKKVKISDVPPMVPNKLKYISLQILMALLSFIFASCNSFFGMAPFGVAFCASVKKKYLFVSVIGSCIGYIVSQDGIFALRYIACNLCIAIVLGSLHHIIKFENVKLIFPIVSAACTMITGTVVLIANKDSLLSILLILCESLISGTSSFFMSRALRIKSLSKGARALNRTDMLYLSILSFIFLLSFSSFEFFGFSPARLLACFTIMTFALFKAEKSGAFFGVLAGIAVGISTGTSTYVAVFAIAGLMSGFFSPLGQLGTSLAFAFSNLISLILLSNSRPSIAVILEVCLSSLIFMLIPKKLIHKLKNFLFSSSNESSSNSESLRQNIVSRLSLASAAVDEVSKEVYRISALTKPGMHPNMNNIYDHVQRHVCASCDLCSFCWIKNLNDTMNVFNDMSVLIQSNQFLEKSNISAHFANRCLNIDKLTNEFNTSYKNELSKINNQDLLSDSQSILAEQFSCVSDILKDLSTDISQNYTFDDITAEKLCYYMQQKKIPIKSVSCVLDNFNHMIVEIVCKKLHTPIRKSELKNIISRFCDREFSDAQVFEVSENLIIRYSEKSVYNVSIGSHQHSYNDNNICGDCCECFCDSKGRQIIVLSDGMGTGRRAAIDGTIASKTLATLVKSGFSFETALKLVNSALLSKSLDESLATLDIACIDSFSGKVEFYKAGAAPSAIKKGKNAVLIEKPSLPAGILSQVEFSRCKTNLSEGDIVLLMSDGVFGDNNDWITTLLTQNADKSADKIAHLIADEAIKRKAHNDDVTVIAAVLN